MNILRTEFIQNNNNINNIPDIFPEFMAPELSELHLNGIVVKEAHLKGYKLREVIFIDLCLSLPQTLIFLLQNLCHKL